MILPLRLASLLSQNLHRWSTSCLKARKDQPRLYAPDFPTIIASTYLLIAPLCLSFLELVMFSAICHGAIDSAGVSRFGF